jgi:hypothetical protein
MGRIEKPEDSSTIRTDIVLDDPALLIITLLLVVRLISSLVERVSDAFFEDLFGVFRLRGTLCPRNSFRQPEIVQERSEIVWMELDAELFVEKMLDFL